MARAEVELQGADGLGEREEKDKKRASFGGAAPAQGPGPAEIEEAHRAALRRYADLLASCTTARLTGTRGAEELYSLHVVDCLESVPFLPPAGQVLDLGSGGGLPGLIWAICRPDLRVLLLDSVGKKCRAVQEIAEALALSNVTVLCARSEEAVRTRRESFALAGARAVASAGVTAELLSPFVEVGGTLLTFKGPKLDAELAEVRGRWQGLGLRAPLVQGYGGPESSRRLVLWEKAWPCPRAYPRPTGAASMKGWWL